MRATASPAFRLYVSHQDQESAALAMLKLVLAVRATASLAFRLCVSHQDWVSAALMILELVLAVRTTASLAFRLCFLIRMNPRVLGVSGGWLRQLSFYNTQSVTMSPCAGLLCWHRVGAEPGSLLRSSKAPLTPGVHLCLSSSGIYSLSSLQHPPNARGHTT